MGDKIFVLPRWLIFLLLWTHLGFEPRTKEQRADWILETQSDLEFLAWNIYFNSTWQSNVFDLYTQAWLWPKVVNFLFNRNWWMSPEKELFKKMPVTRLQNEYNTFFRDFLTTSLFLFRLGVLKVVKCPCLTNFKGGKLTLFFSKLCGNI